MSGLILENVSKTFLGSQGQTIRALKNLTLAMKAKELFVLLGPSGCGKSTTLRLIAGLEQPDSGSILMDGEVLNYLPPTRRDVAMVFQNLALYPHMTVRENIGFGLMLRKHPKLEIERRVCEAAAMLGLESVLDRLPATLSGGEKQRVALGRAIVRQPKIFLFDEPLSGLDNVLRLELRAEIRRLHGQLGITTLYVTHDQAEAMALGDRVAVMRAGSIEQKGTAVEVYHRPANRFVASFLGSLPMNIFRGRVTLSEGGVVVMTEVPSRSADGALALKLDDKSPFPAKRYVNQEVDLGIRPEDLRLGAETLTKGVFDQLTLVLERIEAAGFESHYHLIAGNYRFVARGPANQLSELGREVSVSFDTSKLHFFHPDTGRSLLY